MGHGCLAICLGMILTAVTPMSLRSRGPGWIAYGALALSLVGVLLLLLWLLFRAWTTLRWYQIRPLEVILAIAVATLELGLLLQLPRVAGESGLDRIQVITFILLMIAFSVGGGAAHAWRQAWIRGETGQGNRIRMLLMSWLLTGIPVVLVALCLAV